MQIEKNYVGGTSVWATILLKQFQNGIGFHTEHENKRSVPSHIGRSITTFRDMYLHLIVRRKNLHNYFYKVHQQKSTATKISFSFLYFTIPPQRNLVETL